MQNTSSLIGFDENDLNDIHPVHWKDADQWRPIVVVLVINLCSGFDKNLGKLFRNVLEDLETFEIS